VIAARLQNALVMRDWQTVDECISRLEAMELSDWSILSQALLIRGRPGAAVEHQLRVCRADPLSAGASMVLQLLLACAGRFDEAETEYRKYCDPASAIGAIEIEAFRRALALGDRETARTKLRWALGLPHFLTRARELSEALDDREEALAILEIEIRESIDADPLAAGLLAHIAVFFDAQDLALRALRIANIEIGLSHFNLLELWHPCLAPLHHRREFKSLIEEIGLAEHCRATGLWGEFLTPVGDGDFEIN
jgi:hypothetical protein